MTAVAAASSTVRSVDPATLHVVGEVFVVGMGNAGVPGSLCYAYDTGRK